jgi:putative NADH-flavin reductase
MRLLLLGCTGSTGILVAREALRVFQGCTLILYARSPDKIPEDLSSHQCVIIVQGELNDPGSLEKALEGADAVVSTLGPSTNPTKVIVTTYVGVS